MATAHYYPPVSIPCAGGECDDEKYCTAHFEEKRVVMLLEYEAERRTEIHCVGCVSEARGALAAEACALCPPGRHQECEFHR